MLDKPIYGAPSADSFRKRLQIAAASSGIAITVNPYTGRRGAGEAFDNSGKYCLFRKSDFQTYFSTLAFISVAKRDKLMQHGDERVFDRSYHSDHLAVDVSAAVRNQEPQINLLQAATGLNYERYTASMAANSRAAGVPGRTP